MLTCDFVRRAGQPQLTRWGRQCLARIASIYGLHKARLAEHELAEFCRRIGWYMPTAD